MPAITKHFEPTQNSLDQAIGNLKLDTIVHSYDTAIPIPIQNSEYTGHRYQLPRKTHVGLSTSNQYV
jgi:hypothetical protein